MPALRTHVSRTLIGVFLLAFTSQGLAREPDGTPEGAVVVELAPATPLPPDLVGKPITRIDVVTVGGRWQVEERLAHSPLGRALSADVARGVARELLATGRYADSSVEAFASGRGVGLRVRVVPRRVVAQVRVTGGGLDEALILEAAGVGPGADLTLKTLPEIEARVRELFQHRGYPDAAVSADAIDTDDPMQVVLHLSVRPSDPLTVARRTFEVHPRLSPELESLVDSYAVDSGDRLDEEEIAHADQELMQKLRAASYGEAGVEHRVEWRDVGSTLVVVVWAGAKARLAFEGNESFDADELRAALELDAETERTPDMLVRAAREFYVQRGFLDVTVRVARRESSDGSSVDFVVQIREGEPVTVRGRHFPCLSGERSASDLASEIDGVLSDVLPSAGLLGPAAGSTLDQRLAPQSQVSRHVTPLTNEPWTTYDPAAYDKVLDHLRSLYRSEGYLSAEVGPVQVLRRACDPRSPVGQCVPLGPRLPPPVCGAPAPKAEALECVPDPRTGRRCEPEVELSIPVVLGPRAELWDLGFDGNRTLVEGELRAVTALTLGQPVSQLALEEARRRIVERYAEEGYVFAGVELELELSPDGTRAKARFVINEREPVQVRDVVVRGAHFTDTELIESRAAIRPGELYRRSLVRATEERLATLGVFTSVTVDLEDPEVPARQKVAVIRVQERLPQYLDVRPGFSTGEGLRIAFEYGHRNLARRAIQLALRVQLSYLPPALILEDTLRAKFEELQENESLLFLLERRNSITLEFPEVGLGPLFRLGVEGLDSRDLAREFAIEKRAAFVTLGYRPDRSVSLSLGGSLELNEAEVLESLESIFETPPNDLGNLIRFPDGLTLAIAQRIAFTWDRRDNAVAATRGTLLSLNLEHVVAYPIDDQSPLGEMVTSDYKGHFMQYTGRVAGYLPLSQGGMALAMSLRFGFNQQLEKGSSTYPDRLFFLGGVDSLRGFPMWSVVPEDVYRRLGEDNIVLRGGDVVINPRAELRIPVFGMWQTGLFLDTGNLWQDAGQVMNTFALRYSAGLGLRVTTPVGPLALDYGVNLDPRPKEDFGAFHFSIGLF